MEPNDIKRMIELLEAISAKLDVLVAKPPVWQVTTVPVPQPNSAQTFPNWTTITVR